MPAHLHFAILWVCAAAAAVVFGIMILSVATFRRGAGSGVARRRVLEVLWAIVPIAIMAASAMPAMRTALNAPPGAVRVAHSDESQEHVPELLSITAAASYNADRK